MRFKQYINEIFNQEVKLKPIKDGSGEWEAGFFVGEDMDLYKVTAARLFAGEVFINSLSDKELKATTGYTKKDVKDADKVHQQMLKNRQPFGPPAINNVRNNINQTLNDVWVIGFSSDKHGTFMLKTMNQKDVSTVFSGVKQAVEMFLKKHKPQYVIIDYDPSEEKRKGIYFRFVKMMQSMYKLVGSKAPKNFDYGSMYSGWKTKGWLLAKT